MTDQAQAHLGQRFDVMLPVAARRYLEHTKDGRTIREIAREAGCHASTILRQVRKLELLRDDPLVDQALAEKENTANESDQLGEELDQAVTALKSLSQPGAMILYNRELPQPAIVKTTGEGDAKVVGTIDANLAAALLMRNWVACNGGTTVKRYRITSEGRTNLPNLVAAQDGRAFKAIDATQSAFKEPDTDGRSRNRYASNGPGFESPLVTLSRRKGPDGKPFLTSEFVNAGDQLFQDYSIAGFNQKDLLNWVSPDELGHHYATAAGIRDKRRSDAFKRTLDAIKDLGPGLSDVVLRCCCFREGLEATEKRMGWSARSGKVVLRIALQRLSQFYLRNLTYEGALIG